MATLTVISSSSATIKTPLMVGVAVIQQKNMFLLCKRSIKGPQPSYWEFPGGKVEGNESVPDTIRRELLEELNIQCIVGKKFGEFHWQYDALFVHLVCYFVTIKSGTLALQVHEDMAWCTLHDLTRYNVLPSNKQIIQKLLTQMDELY